tara:strand:+ start:267 stop:410 length:144 start_codon:yes stop_codon:yes gene_type:complete
MNLLQDILTYACVAAATGFLVLKWFFPQLLKSKKSSGQKNCGTDCGC